MAEKFDKPFSASIKVEEAEDYPGLASVSVTNEATWREMYRWTGADLAEGVAAAVSCLIATREVHNREHAKIKEALAREQNEREEFGERSDPTAESGTELKSTPLKAVGEDVPF